MDICLVGRPWWWWWGGGDLSSWRTSCLGLRITTLPGWIEFLILSSFSGTAVFDFLSCPRAGPMSFYLPTSGVYYRTMPLVGWNSLVFAFCVLWRGVLCGGELMRRDEERPSMGNGESLYQPAGWPFTSHFLSCFFLHYKSLLSAPSACEE